MCNFEHGASQKVEVPWTWPAGWAAATNDEGRCVVNSQNLHTGVIACPDCTPTCPLGECDGGGHFAENGFLRNCRHARLTSASVAAGMPSQFIGQTYDLETLALEPDWCWLALTGDDALKTACGIGNTLIADGMDAAFLDWSRCRELMGNAEAMQRLQEVPLLIVADLVGGDLQESLAKQFLNARMNYQRRTIFAVTAPSPREARGVLGATLFKMLSFCKWRKA